MGDRHRSTKRRFRPEVSVEGLGLGPGLCGDDDELVRCQYVEEWELW